MGANIWIMKNKKASMTIIMSITIILVSVLIIYAVSAQFFRSVDTGLQDAICRANVVGLHSLKQDSTETGFLGAVWRSTRDTAVESAQKRPLCATKTHIIDVSNIRDKDEQLARITVELGTMMTRCWSTFGEGRISNTFGQSEGFLGEYNSLSGDTANYYFSCYRFKIQFPSSEDSVSIDDLQKTLFGVNIQGRPLYDKDGVFVPGGTRGDFSKDHVQILRNYFSFEKIQPNLEVFSKDPSPRNTPYAGHIVWPGYGYFEFVGEAAFERTPLLSLDALVAMGKAYPLTGLVGSIKAYFNKQRDILIPSNPDLYMEELQSDEWYEVRYYSPYIIGGPSGMVVNNIKIMPAGVVGGTPVTPIALS